MMSDLEPPQRAQVQEKREAALEVSVADAVADGDISRALFIHCLGFFGLAIQRFNFPLSLPLPPFPSLILSRIFVTVAFFKPFTV